MKDLPADQRPREKLLARGAKALTDAELLALLLRTGYQGHGVMVLAQEVLNRCGGFAGLLNIDLTQLKTIKGLGPAKRAEVLAVMEMARRALAQPLQSAPVFDTPNQLQHYLGLQLGGRLNEVFAVLFLDVQHRMLAFEEMFSGSVAHTSVHPREVVRRALALNASAVVIAHNHPSGVAEPSTADVHLTQTLVAALKLMDVKLLDHFIVGQGHVTSLREQGLLP
jgi:DNA repair protein RadC